MSRLKVGCSSARRIAGGTHDSSAARRRVRPVRFSRHRGARSSAAPAAPSDGCRPPIDRPNRCRIGRVPGRLSPVLPLGGQPSDRGRRQPCARAEKLLQHQPGITRTQPGCLSRHEAFKCATSALERVDGLPCDTRPRDALAGNRFNVRQLATGVANSSRARP